jgi:hypothetical protein
MPPVIANSVNLVRQWRMLGLAIFAAALVGTQAGTALASAGSACVLTNAQATSILGAPASHGKTQPRVECVYSSSSSSITIDRFFPVSRFPSVAELKKLTGATSITTLHGIGERAELVKVKGKGIEIVSLYFAAGDSYYAIGLALGDSKPTNKQIMLLEAAAKAAAKKL